jgi:hypothetical protein
MSCHTLVSRLRLRPGASYGEPSPEPRTCQSRGRDGWGLGALNFDLYRAV